MSQGQRISLTPLFFLALIAIGTGGADTAAAADSGPSAADVRKAVERSLPYLASGGITWIEQHDCLSCHQVPFYLWSHNLARTRGIAVDEQKLAKWTEWSARKSLAQREPFRLTEASLEQLGTADGLPAETLARFRPLVNQPFDTQEAFSSRLDQFATSNELGQHREAVIRRASPAPGSNDGGGLDTLGQILLGRAAGGAPDSEPMKRFIATTPAMIVSRQRTDGSWEAGGQLPRQDRPAAEADAVSTRWALLALGTVERPDARTTQSIRRALDALEKRARDAKPFTSTESLITTILVARRFGAPGDDRPDITHLLSRQNPDGGWAWKDRGAASDGFATGQALYALSQAGNSEVAPTIARARRYLISTQQPDGGWPTTGEGISNASTPARKKKVEPIYRYWATAWATIGLTSSLPRGQTPDAVQTVQH
jgi:hypothetical protein